MSETGTAPETQEEKIPPYRGLYRHVKISVKALDCVIVACILVILAVVALEMRDPGFTITFDSRGGTDVAAQKQMYGELLELPEPPTREGYAFRGWYVDEACLSPWDFASSQVVESMTLYAAWDPIA